MSRSLAAFFAAAVVALTASIMPHPARAGEVGIVTMMDGDAFVVRETRRFAAAEGLRLMADDIVQTGASTRLLRLEFGDGAVIDLGGGSAALIAPRAFAGGGRVTAAYLSAGWAKWSSPGLQSGGIATPRLDLARLAGTVVLHVAPTVTLAFVESGHAEVQEHDGEKASALQPIGEGDAWRIRDGRSERLKRPPEELSAMPRAFADTLPRRAPRWQSTSVAPAAAREVTYAEVASWINSEAALRPLFLSRFGPLVRDKAFRAQAVAELRAHPEWKDLLFPPPPPKPKPALAAPRPAGPVHAVGQRAEQALQNNISTSPETL